MNIFKSYKHGLLSWEEFALCRKCAIRGFDCTFCGQHVLVNDNEFTSIKDALSFVYM